MQVPGNHLPLGWSVTWLDRCLEAQIPCLISCDMWFGCSSTSRGEPEANPPRAQRHALDNDGNPSFPTVLAVTPGSYRIVNLELFLQSSEWHPGLLGNEIKPR